MGTQITFRRGSSFPTAGSGITLAEPVFETTLHTFHIGLGNGITAEWVGAPISGASAEIAAGITYKTPTLKAVKDYVTDYVTAVNGVLTVNGFAGGVTLNAGTATGVTSSGGNITVTNLGVQSFNGRTGAVQGVSSAAAGTGISVSGATGTVTITNIGVQSFNGLTGSVGGVCAAQANTFTALQSFNSGISANGGTFGTITASTANLALFTIYDASLTVSPSSTMVFGTTSENYMTINTDENSIWIAPTGNQDVYIGGAAYTNDLTAQGYFTGYTADFNRLVTAKAGITTSYLYASTGSTFASTLQVNGGATFSGTLNGATATFSRLTTHTAGISATGMTSGGDIRLYGARSIVNTGSLFTIKGITTGTAVASNSILLSGTNADLQLNSSTGYVTIDRGWETTLTSYVSGLKFNFYDEGELFSGAVTIQPLNSLASATVYIPNTNGTLALTSQLMGAVNGSTAATTAVTSFNGLTGAVGGVCAAQANTFTAVQTFNSGISAGLGVTFSRDIRVNGIVVGLGRTGEISNLAVGASALGSLISGNNSVAIGSNAMSDGTYYSNSVAIGANSQKNNTGSGIGNVTVGSLTMQTYNTASSNVGIGGNVLVSANDAVFNVAVGANAMINGYNASYNIAVGGNALQGNADGGNNTAIGYNSLYTNDASNDNTAVGYLALEKVYWGSGFTSDQNVALGSGAGRYRGTGTGAIANRLNSANRSIFIGYRSRAAADSQENQIVIGTDVVGGGSNTTTIGSTYTTNTYLYGRVDAIDGVSAPGGTFSALTRFTGGITTSSLYASTGSTFGSTLQVNGGATLAGRVDVGGILRVVGGTTFESTTDHAGVARFASGVTISGTLNGATATFSRLTTHAAGISAAGGVTLAQNSKICFNGIGNIEAIGSSLVLGEDSNRVYIGDYQGFGNSTHMQFRDGTGAVDIVSPFGVVSIGDYSGVNNGAYINVDNTDGSIYTLSGPFTIVTNTFQLDSANGITFTSPSGGNFNVSCALVGATASFSRRATFSAGISASGGVTFGGTVASDTGYRITSNAINTQTGTTYTFLSSDNGKVVTFNNASGITAAIPTGLPVGFSVTVIQLGAGQVGFSADAGVTLNSYTSLRKIAGQHGSVSLVSYSSNVYNLAGNLA